MPDHQPYVPATQSPAELTPRALLLGVLLGLIFSASSVYLALKIGLTVSSSIPIAVLSITIFRALGRTSILENNIVQTTGSASDSVAAGVVFTIPAILLMGYDLDIGRVAVLATVGGLMGILMMIPLRRALIVKEHDTLVYPEGTACAEVLIAGEERGLQAKRVFQAFGVGFVYKFLQAGLKFWPDVPGKALGFYPGAAVFTETSPELLGVGYIIGPRIAGEQVAGGEADPRHEPRGAPGQLRVLHRGGCRGLGRHHRAGPLAADDHELLRLEPQRPAPLEAGPGGDPAADRGRSSHFPHRRRLRRARHRARPAAAGGGQPARRSPDRDLRLLLRHRLLPHLRADRLVGEPHFRHDDRRAPRNVSDLCRHRLDRRGPPGSSDLDRRGGRRGHSERRQHVPGPEDRFPRRRHAASPADRHPGGRARLGARGRLDPHPAQPRLHLPDPRDPRCLQCPGPGAGGGRASAGRDPAGDRVGLPDRRQRLGGPRELPGRSRLRC